nr:hypothetical protein [Variovorax boronicumulans]
MKRRVLGCALVSLASAGTLDAFGQVAAPAAAPAASAANAVPGCNAQGCSTAEGQPLFQRQPRSVPDAQAPAPAPAGRTVGGTGLSLQLPGGGIVWATEDPALGLPELSVSGPAEVAFENGRLTRAVPFYLRSNYPAFVRRFELTLYRASDSAYTEPLAVLAMPVGAVSRVEWSGAPASRFPLRTGDELVYVLRAYGADGAVDETLPRSLRLARPEDVERRDTQLRDSAERSLGQALSLQQAQAQRLVDSVFASNDLRQQNIAMYGSRIRIQGRNLPEGASLEINGQGYPTDLQRKFVAEFLSPVGLHRFDLTVRAPGQAPLQHVLEVDVTGKYLFGVGIADLTVFQNQASGPGRELALNGRERSVLSNGRLAFYGKAKIDGTYLVTGQADTQERDVRRLFSGFTRADPQDIFRRLDPDLYYPTYGDDSTTVRDVDTQGRFYLRVDWDKNQALWGNYQTGLTGTAYGQYIRSLYGAAAKWRSTGTNPWGEASTQLRAFASEAQTAPGHSEFVGTGGSLYYLRHTDILPGSEVVVVEQRNRSTGRVESRRQLLRGTDYEISDLQGRIILLRPLLQFADDGLQGITRDTPLAGLEQYLLADYEWIPTSFDSGNLAAGIRGKQWIGDHVAVGATYVDEGRAGEDYSLKGVDVTLQAGRGTTLRLERSNSRASSAPVFVSSNGGLSFAQRNPELGARAGHATLAEAQASLQELGWTERNWTVGAWWRRVDAGFSAAREDYGVDRLEVGAEVRGQVSDTVEILAQHSRATRGAEALEQTRLTAQWRPTEDDTVTGELRRITQERLTGPAQGTLGAVKYGRRVTPQLELYGIAQQTLDDDGGRYPDNDATTLGARYRFDNLSVLGAEVTHGDRGNAAQLNGEYRLNTDHSLYGTITHATDTSDYDALFNQRLQSGWTLGQRWRLNERSNLYNESQFLKEREGRGLVHTFGMDFYPAVGWSTGFTLQKGDLDTSAGTVHRRAVSVSAGRVSASTEWSSKLEWREDTGAERRRQWVSTNRVNHKLDEDWRVSGRLNHSRTRDQIDALAGARFTEAGAGFAWRPHDDARYALLGRYTYLYDLLSLGQIGNTEYDQRAHVVSLEGIYRYDHRWEFAAKLAEREGAARARRGTGPWFDSSTRFAAVQARYTLPEQWHALAEYRWLDVKSGGTRQGWLAGIDRDITKNLRLGVGYNFTDFSDDLTRYGYRYRGWYINVVGSY